MHQSTLDFQSNSLCKYATPRAKWKLGLWKIDVLFKFHGARTLEHWLLIRNPFVGCNWMSVAACDEETWCGMVFSVAVCFDGLLLL